MKKLAALCSLILLAGAGCALPSSQPSTPAPAPEPAAVTGPEEGMIMEQEPATTTATEESTTVTTGGAAVTGEIKEISIQGLAFVPNAITVKKGDRVTWTNKDAKAHTVTALDGSFGSALIQTGKSFTLDTAKLAAGTYSYKCTPHPFMTATLVVQ